MRYDDEGTGAAANVAFGSEMPQTALAAGLQKYPRAHGPDRAKALNRLRDSLPPDGLDGERYPEGKISGSGRGVLS